MISLFRTTTFLVLLTRELVEVNGQEHYAISNQVLYDSGMVLQEHFYAPLDFFVNSTEYDSKERGNLRRELQTNPVCRATRPSGNTFVCGGWAGGDDDPCRNSQATCSGLTYPCSCSGSSETTCSYCQLRGANAILCQQSGTRTTFRDLSGKTVTCSCEYIGNGQVRQECYEPNSVPVPLQTNPPTAVRAPPAPFPTPGIPIPGVTPPPSLPATPTTPPQTPPINTQVACRATNPSNVNLGVGSTCSAVSNYPCSCTGSGETSCSYCQVRTLNAVICQVTGSDVTFIDPTGIYKTCHCEYRGNGQVQQYCYQVIGGGAAPTNPAPVWTPTSQRAPTLPVPSPIPIPVPVPVAAVVPAVPQPKKNKKRA